MIIQADLHTHSIASTHAYSTITENAAAAKTAGLKAFALTDHAPTIADSPHIWHEHNYRVLPRFIDGVMLLFGIEANILNTNGDIDITQLEETTLDWIIASVHTDLNPPTNMDDHTAYYVNTAKNNPAVDVIGHPYFTNLPYDYELFVKTCKEYDKLIEINEAHIRNYPKSRAIVNDILGFCKKYETQICVNSDAHYHAHIGNFPLSAELIADFPTALIFNADIDRVLDRIRKKNIKRPLDK